MLMLTMLLLYTAGITNMLHVEQRQDTLTFEEPWPESQHWPDWLHSPSQIRGGRSRSGWHPAEQYTQSHKVQPSKHKETTITIYIQQSMNKHKYYIS